MTSKQPKDKKSLSMNDLEKIKLNIPLGMLPAGLAIVAVFTESGTQLGYIDMKDMPPIKSIGDITRLNGIQRIVGSNETVDNRSRQGQIVKIVSKRLTNIDQPNFGPAGPKNVGDAIGLGKALEENKYNISRNTAIAYQSRDVKRLLLRAVDKSAEVLRDYAIHQVTSGGVKKSFKDFAETVNLPYWLFVHLTTKSWVTDTPQDPLTYLVFPKNTSKGLALRVSEWKKPDITDWLAPLLRNSALIYQAIIKKDLIVGTTDADRSSRDNESFENLIIPVLPFWTLHENAVARRTANPVTIRDGTWAPFHALVGRIFLTAVGNGPRNITPKTFWKTIADFDIDVKSIESPLAKYAESVPANPAPILRMLEEAEGSDTLFYLTTGLEGQDARAAELKAGIAAFANPAAIGPDVAMPATDHYDVFIQNITVRTEENRALQTIALALTNEEKTLLEDPKWALPVQKQKARRFPLGDAPTASATQLLNAIKPGPRPEEDRHFSGLYPILLDLFSSFNTSKVANRAVSMVRASMVRMKGEGLFFSTDSLTGQGGELISGTDEQLFEDI